MSTQMIENPVAIAPSAIDLPVVNVIDARRAANEYVKAQIDPTLTVVSSHRRDDKLRRQENWRFYIRCDEGPLAPIYVQAYQAEVTPLSPREICIIREKAAILRAQGQGIIPRDDKGYILSEYAKRQARTYLADALGMYFDADDPIFADDDPPVWQVTILFKRYTTGPFTLGLMDVDACSGEVIPLDNHQLNNIQERLRAIIGPQP